MIHQVMDHRERAWSGICPLRPSNFRQYRRQKCTEDWALVDLDRGKFNWNAFRGYVIHLGTFRSISLRLSGLTIYLGTKLTAGDFMEKIYPHPETRAQFKYAWWPHATSRLR